MAWTVRPSSLHALSFSMVWEIHWTLVKSRHPCLSDSSQEKLSGGANLVPKSRDCTALIQSRWHWALALTIAHNVVSFIAIRMHTLLRRVRVGESVATRDNVDQRDARQDEPAALISVSAR